MNDSDQRGVEASVTRIWAKTNSATGQWHPLLYHLVETSAVASLLWDEILAPSTCKVIADALGLPLDESRQWSLFLVGAHDLGKASPSFQCKWAPSVLPLQQLSYRFPVNVMPIPHGRVSSIALARILEKRGVERRVAKEIARAVGGHHGVFDTASVLQQASPQAVGLVMHGDADRILPISASGLRTAKLIKGARLLVVKDGRTASPGPMRTK